MLYIFTITITYYLWNHHHHFLCRRIRSCLSVPKLATTWRGWGWVNFKIEGLELEQLSTCELSEAPLKYELGAGIAVQQGKFIILFLRKG